MNLCNYVEAAHVEISIFRNALWQRYSMSQMFLIFNIVRNVDIIERISALLWRLPQTTLFGRLQKQQEFLEDHRDSFYMWKLYSKQNQQQQQQATAVATSKQSDCKFYVVNCV